MGLHNVYRCVYFEQHVESNHPAVGFGAAHREKTDSTHRLSNMVVVVCHSRDPQGGVEPDDHEYDQMHTHEERGKVLPSSYHSQAHSWIKTAAKGTVGSQ